MRKILPLLGLLAMTATAHAQTVFSHGWSIWCEYEQNNLQQTTDGGYILCTDAVPEMDTVNNLAWCYLIKLDSMGNQQWAVQFEKSTYFQKAMDGNSVVQTSDGGYAVATVMYTSTPSTNSSHTAIFVVKTNAMGGLLWSKTYPGIGNSSASCIKETLNHDLIIAGNTTDTSVYREYGYLLRLDSTGNMVWGKAYSQVQTQLSSQFYTATETYDSGFIVAGILGGNGVTMKTDFAGNVLWANEPSVAGGAQENHVIETSDGFYVSCGINYSSSATASITKYDPMGNFVWGNTYLRQGPSTSASDYAYSVVEATNGYTISTGGGQASTFTGLLRVDTAGQPIWAKLYTDTYVFHPVDLEHTTDNGYAMCTTYYNLSTSSFADWKVALLKVDSAGKAACHDSVIVDTAVAYYSCLPMPVSVVSINPMSPIPTVLHYVLLPDTNFCLAPDGVDENLSDYGVHLYPNPAGNEVHVLVDGLSTGEVKISMYNSLGQLVDEQGDGNSPGAWNAVIATAGYPEGIYFAVVEVNGSVIASEKVVIQR